jgi:hypothetical protein
MLVVPLGSTAHEAISAAVARQVSWPRRSRPSEFQPKLGLILRNGTHL